ncbi:MAG: lipopolysaccharide heptosyltransferase family protein, partial [Motiliproteus sp.]|nr:lipopolysaccharide heptosyltransferase family protein [Motiliproteus sp.]
MKLWFERGAWASRKGRKAAAALQPEAVRKIAVIRHAALGDMVIARPFLLELRRFFPNAEITLSLTSNYTYGAPEDLVDRVHTVYGQDQRDIPKREQIRRAKELGEQDIIFDLAATARSFHVTTLNKAKLKVGFPYKRVQNYLYYDIGILRTDFRFEGEILLDFLHIFGHRCEYPLNFTLPQFHANNSKQRIVYFFGASTAEKCYPEEKMIAVIAQLAKDLPNHQHIVLEGIKADEKADHILEQLSEFTNVSNQSTLDLDQLTD